MEWNDWLLALHVLSAFALAGAIVFFWAVVFALRRAELSEEIASVGRLMTHSGPADDGQAREATRPQSSSSGAWGRSCWSSEEDAR